MERERSRSLGAQAQRWVQGQGRAVRKLKKWCCRWRLDWTQTWGSREPLQSPQHTQRGTHTAHTAGGSQHTQRETAEISHIGIMVE